MIMRNGVLIVGSLLLVIYFTYHFDSSIIIRNVGINVSMFKSCPNDIRILTVQPKGNLGNLIWEYMSLYAIFKMSAENSFLTYIENSMKEKLESVFESLSLPTSHFVEGVRRVKILPRDKPITSETLNDNCSSLLLEEYSARYEDVIKFGVNNIRKELRFKKNLVDDAMDVFRGARKVFRVVDGDATFVGIHYRGTDYVEHLIMYHGSLYKGPPDYRYYVKAMDYFKAMYKNVIFFLISIDYAWLEKNELLIRDNGNVLTNPYHNDPVKDLVLLSHCNHSIINYGTYGVTAALLNQGTTFVYNLQLPLDHRGQTVGMGISKILNNWFMLPYSNDSFPHAK